MSRVKRNLSRKRMKRRRRGIFFSLFLISVLFALALIVTNNTMVQATGLSTEENLITMERIGEFVIDKTDKIVDKIQEIDIDSLRQETEKIIKDSISFLKAIKAKWESL